MGPVLAALLSGAGKTREDALRAPKNAKGKVRVVRELQAWIAQRLAMDHPARVCNPIRGNM